MAVIIPRYKKSHKNFFYNPWRDHDEKIHQASKTWQDDFGYILHPLRNIERSLEHTSDEASTVGDEGFHVCVDVHQFKPDEVTLKTHDHFIVIGGKHEERLDEHGSITRQFERRYKLPDAYDTRDVTSEMSADGILTIKAPNPAATKNTDRKIHIRTTGLGFVVNEAMKPPFVIKPIAFKMLNQANHLRV